MQSGVENVELCTLHGSIQRLAYTSASSELLAN